MNKHQGLTIGAILLAGLIARSVSTNQTEIREAPHQVSAAAEKSTASHKSDAVGPWIASCNYWASVKPFSGIPDSSHVSSPRHSSAKDEEAGSEELGCPNANEDKWGFPDDSSAITVATIIATVPDPVHTHAAMMFDRTIAALLQAAQDHGYLSSYYWVPWKRYGKDANGSSDGSEAEEPGHDPVRECQPGLLVLKSTSSFKKVIYMFLVGESPTEGVYGFQLQNAFQYESDVRGLLKKRNGHFSSGRDGHIWIIGPNYTGSAASLMAGIESEAGNDHHHDHSPIFDVSGSTSTKIAAETLSSCEPIIRFHSFDPDGDYSQQLLLDQLSRSGYDLRDVAILVESSTSRGAAAATHYSPPPQSDSQYLPADSKPLPCRSRGVFHQTQRLVH